MAGTPRAQRRSHPSARAVVVLVLTAVLATVCSLLAASESPTAAAADPCSDPQVATSTVVAGFEIDGNLCTNTAGNQDWDTAGTQPVESDPAGSNDNSAFTGGAAENGWPWSASQTQGSNPSSSSDITHVFAFSHVVGSDVVAYFGWERVAGTGSAGFYVELNQKPNRFGPVPDRTSGDLRLRFTQSGNTLMTLDNAATWDATGPDSGSWVSIPVAGYAAAVNAQAVTNLPGLTPNPLPPGTFAEAAVDLTQLFAGTGECSGAFGTFNLRSVSSLTATNPPLQDWAGPVALGVPPTCASVLVDKEWHVDGTFFRSLALPPGFSATLTLGDATGTRPGLEFGHDYGLRADGTDFEQGDAITIGEDAVVPPGCTNTASGDTGPQTLTTTGINHFTVVNTVDCPSFLTITKRADPTTFTAPGTTITYTYDVVNRGDTTLGNVLVTDPHHGLSTITCDPAQHAVLDPGDTMRCTATYGTTQADVDAGAVTNTGTVTGRTPTGGAVIDRADAVVTAIQAPAIGVHKTAAPTRFSRAGQVIVYTYRVTNTGNVTLHAVTLADDRLGHVACPHTTLAPHAQMDCTATYTTTAADLDGGPITNTARVTGTSPGGATVTARALATITPGAAPAPGTPHLSTHTTRLRVVPLQPFRDLVHARGVTGTTGVAATARLYGPFGSRAALGCGASHLVRTLQWQIHNGVNRSPSVRIGAPGLYTWRVSTRADASNRTATHPCGQYDETTLVAKSHYRAPIVNGGYSGTIRRLGAAGAAGVVPTRIRMPAIGLDALVFPEHIAAGQMTLPADVAEVGWLRRSAAPGDAIGTTVIAGHVSDWYDDPGALYLLDRAHRGERVTVTTGGASYRFTVSATATFLRGHRLPQRYFATAGRHRLVLISCTGKVVYPDGHFHYTRYQVVVANLSR